MRLAPLLALALIAAPAYADSPSAKPEQASTTSQEAGLYRFGATYSVLPGDTASACKNSCADDAACIAWSYVSTFEGTEARCELKRGGGKARPDPLATSGISPRHEALYAPPPEPELEGGPEAE